jgi:hypothetical protein
MAKQILKRGGIVLVRYPFTDLSGSKVRPALALTPDDLLSQMDDALFLFISSTIPLNLLPTDLVLKRDHPGSNWNNRISRGICWRSPRPDW